MPGENNCLRPPTPRQPLCGWVLESFVSSLAAHWRSLSSCPDTWRMSSTCSPWRTWSGLRKGCWCLRLRMFWKLPWITWPAVRWGSQGRCVPELSFMHQGLFWVLCTLHHLTLTDPEGSADNTISRWEKWGAQLLSSRAGRQAWAMCLGQGAQPCSGPPCTPICPNTATWTQDPRGTGALCL